MKSIFYQLLSKGLMLAILLTVVAGYYYREALFPKWFPAEEAVEAEATPVVDAVAVDAAVAEQAEPDTAVMPEAADEPSVAESATETTTSAGAQGPVFRPLEEQTAAPPAPVAAETEAVAPSMVAEEVKPADLTAARTAYWQRDIDAAVAAYQAAIAAQPDNADAHGELGNVYFSQGRAEAASQSYLRAAELLLAQGNVQGASSLMPVLLRLSPENAAVLARKLAESSGQGGQP